MNFRFLLFIIVTFGLPATRLKAEDFALISPSVADSIKSRLNTPAAKGTIISANTNLGRSPHPVPKIQMAGRLPGDAVYEQSKLADADLPVVSDFALAFRLTGDTKYLDAANQFINSWLSAYSTELNPINDQDFSYLFVASDLVSARMPSGLRAKMKSFSQNFARAYLGDIESHPASAPNADNTSADGVKADPTRVNNFQSHRVKLAALAAFASGDAGLIERARRAFQKQVAINIHPDGSVEDFRQRDAIDYVTYDLDPLLLTAIAARAHGEDWFAYKSPTGSSLEKAVDWLLPYVDGTKTHEEFAHTTVPFDITRRKAGLPGFSGPWNPKGATSTLSLASALRPKYRRVLEDLEARTNTRTPRFIALAFE